MVIYVGPERAVAVVKVGDSSRDTSNGSGEQVLNLSIKDRISTNLKSSFVTELGDRLFYHPVLHSGASGKLEEIIGRAHPSIREGEMVTILEQAESLAEALKQELVHVDDIPRRPERRIRLPNFGRDRI